MDAAVAELLRAGNPAWSAAFAASCAERMAQLFTGLRGGDPGRADDVDLYVEVLDELWNPDAASSAFAERVAALDRFAELRPSEEGLVDVADIYAFYGVLCLRYAVLCRATGDPEEAVRCAHASLTAVGQLDRNVPHSSLFEAERHHQRRWLLAGAALPGSLRRLREEDRDASLERLLAVNSRLGK